MLVCLFNVVNVESVPLNSTEFWALRRTGYPRSDDADDATPRPGRRPRPNPAPGQELMAGRPRRSGGRGPCLGRPAYRPRPRQPVQ
ncbi:hypothetical protein OCQ_48080 [Mycobacterium paraintracellulare]|nr:hypothetical protein OCQ_48080 [Mycobacterium paraintracellulare]